MIALWCHAKGYFEKQPDYWRDEFSETDREALYLDVIIRRRDIPDYATEEYWLAYGLWSRWKGGYGWPYSGGWAEQPALVVDYIDALEQARKIYEAEERESK